MEINSSKKAMDSMKESEASTILKAEIVHHPECSIFAEALGLAIQALEKQGKIKEAFEMWKNDTSGIYGADDETTHLIGTLKKILKE